MAARAALALLSVAGVRGIYPEGHWDIVKKCTVENMDATVKETVDAGKTLIVRWIASAG